jgi:hypothetical protein
LDARLKRGTTIPNGASIVNSAGLFSEQPKNQRENQTDKKARDYWEMEAEIVARVMDVAGQSAEPAAAEAGPEQGAEGGNEEAGNDEKFSEIGHRCPT